VLLAIVFHYEYNATHINYHVNQFTNNAYRVFARVRRMENLWITKNQTDIFRYSQLGLEKKKPLRSCLLWLCSRLQLRSFGCLGAWLLPAWHKFWLGAALPRK
jgi:hypothetical protein